MEAIIIDSFRRKLIQNLAGNIAFAKIKFVAFGDGGHNSQNEPKPVNKNQTTLNNQHTIKEFTTISIVDDFTVSVTCTLENTEAIGKVISETAIVDENNAIIGIKNFAPKHKEQDELFEITFKLRV